MNKWKLVKLLLIIAFIIFFVNGFMSSNNTQITIAILLVIALLVFRLVAWLFDKRV